ncbi:hypothetical protein NP233_g2255 [Leucocoprinus birnbaumii]|uniref:Uncharacterized protein n=1 Tax=Leucocoprinus birnbaumii TaxID=56174 RepID=A0AAD5YV25_9AGAR|nr:hypothetical protein NP233_g2255 [Leucocoprinus birnbaumii]
MPPQNVLNASNRPLSCDRALPDRWNASPPQVTSYLSIPRLLDNPTPDLKCKYESPICGLGWQYQLLQSFCSRPSASDAQVQVLVGHLDVSFKPPSLFSALPLSNAVFHVEVTYPQLIPKVAYEKRFNGISLRSSHGLGSYERPIDYEGRTLVVITLIFDEHDGLSLPTSPPVDLQNSLHQTLGSPTFIDTKFYLYSARKRGIPTCPKAMFANSHMLLNSSSYLHDLLSADTDFQCGSSCDLQKDAWEEVNKLTAEAYDYDSDSDLGSLSGDDCEALAEISTDTDADERLCSSEGEAIESPPLSTSVSLDGRAFAINGTAYQTFKKLKSQNMPEDLYPESALVPCSPKSMYRLADYVGLPGLKNLAKEAIRQNITKTNVVRELFSSFAYRYREIIDMEVNFLLRVFTPMMGRELDEAIQLIATGAKPYCSQVLAFLMRRQRGESSEAAWRILNGGELTLKGSNPFNPPEDTQAMTAEVSVFQGVDSQPTTVHQITPQAAVSQAQMRHPPPNTSTVPRYHFFSPVSSSQSPSTRPAGPLYFNARFQPPRNRYS